jgi:hypothetical protein
MLAHVSKAIEEITDDNPEVMIAVGITEDGTTVIRSSTGNVAVLHWLLNKAVFELNMIEVSQKLDKDEAA